MVGAKDDRNRRIVWARSVGLFWYLGSRPDVPDDERWCSLKSCLDRGANFALRIQANGDGGMAHGIGGIRRLNLIDNYF